MLVVTDDDAFSAAMKLGLRDVDMLSLTEAAVWTAVRAGLDVTRGVGALMIDGSVGGLLQLRLYEKLRPSDVVAHVPVIFARARFGGGLAHDLDFYLPPDGTPEQAVRLICHVLGIPMLPAGVAARLGRRLPRPASEDGARRRRRRFPPVSFNAWACGEPVPRCSASRSGRWSAARRCATP